MYINLNRGHPTPEFFFKSHFFDVDNVVDTVDNVVDTMPQICVDAFTGNRATTRIIIFEKRKGGNLVLGFYVHSPTQLHFR